MATHMTPRWLPPAAACALALILQGCATQEIAEKVPTDPAMADCDTVFHCPADQEDIRICADGNQLQVIWQKAGVEAYRLGGILGETFHVRYSQNAQVIRNSLTWQHLDDRYVAFHYLDESRPEVLEAIGVTVLTSDRRRTIDCNDNASSDMARMRNLRRDNAPPAEASSAMSAPGAQGRQ